jgi:hypothetical protein
LKDVFRKQLRVQYPSGCFQETMGGTEPIRMFSGSNLRAQHSSRCFQETIEDAAHIRMFSGNE